MAPRDGADLKEMLAFAANHDKPIFIRYPRTAVPDQIITAPEQIRAGKAEILRRGKDGVLLAYGSLVYPAYYAAEELAKDNIELTVVNARFAKPLDEELLEQMLKEAPFIMTLEEHSIVGGFGSAVLEFASRSEETRKNIHKIITAGVPDRFIEHGPRNKLLELLGLDKDGIIKAVRKMLSAVNTH